MGLLIAAEIEDGDCLQIGIGGMPNAVWRSSSKQECPILGPIRR